MNGSAQTEGQLAAEELIPRTQRLFRVDQIATRFQCTVTHIFNLITQGEIVVPKESIAAAPSRASILVPRSSLVDFVRRRSSSEWLASKRGGKQRKGGAR